MHVVRHDSTQPQHMDMVQHDSAPLTTREHLITHYTAVGRHNIAPLTARQHLITHH